ncbi:hypothetical protein QAD02_021181 [Eretmocerus hayati]|uniref:Uncharacterized protein n=1 Tax=Eretmocerus hayati TaxID=131215 RepID=A0ACC2PPJ1_9HYME|nr:hypothetical protein QAD02_021181 [Eretmocerus hayati]
MFSWAKTFDDTKSIHLHKFIQALHPIYTVPLPQDLERVVLPKAADIIVTENAKKRKSNTLWIQKLSVGNKDVLMSAIIARGQYIYVDFLVASQLGADFEKICKESCKTAVDLYNVRTYSIVHNTNIQLEKIEYSPGYFVFVCNSFDIFLDDLQKKHEPFETTYDKKHEIDEFYDILNNFSCMLKDNVTVNTATKLLIQFFLAQPNNISVAIEKIVQKFFTPFHFAAMYLNPNYKFLVRPQEKSQGFKYISNIMKEFNDLQGIQQYISGGEEFLDLFKKPEGCDEIDADEFWRIASLSYLDMARVGQNLLEIPAFPKLLNPVKVTSLTQHEYNELNSDSVILLLSTLFEEL